MIIDLRQVALTYQSPDGEVEALRDITFSMENGEFVSIVGPSGCGKSTLLSLIAAAVLFLFADSPYAGTAAIFLFNMTMPVTLWALAQRMPGCKGFSFGLLTFALFLGFAPVGLGLAGSSANWLLAALCVLSALLMLPSVEGKPQVRRHV